MNVYSPPWWLSEDFYIMECPGSLAAARIELARASRFCNWAVIEAVLDTPVLRRVLVWLLCVGTTEAAEAAE